MREQELTEWLADKADELVRRDNLDFQTALNVAFSLMLHRLMKERYYPH